MICTGPWDVGMRAGFQLAALEPLDLRCKARPWLRIQNTQLLEAKALQSRSTLRISLDLVKAIRHIVAPGSWI